MKIKECKKYSKTIPKSVLSTAEINIITSYFLVTGIQSGKHTSTNWLFEEKETLPISFTAAESHLKYLIWMLNSRI